jgi:hypothetical protein
MGIIFETDVLLRFQRGKLISNRDIHALLGREIDRNGGSNVKKLITSRNYFETRTRFSHKFRGLQV